MLFFPESNSKWCLVWGKTPALGALCNLADKLNDAFAVETLYVTILNAAWRSGLNLPAM